MLWLKVVILYIALESQIPQKLVDISTNRETWAKAALSLKMFFGSSKNNLLKPIQTKYSLSIIALLFNSMLFVVRHILNVPVHQPK